MLATKTGRDYLLQVFPDGAFDRFAGNGAAGNPVVDAQARETAFRANDYHNGLFDVHEGEVFFFLPYPDLRLLKIDRHGYVRYVAGLTGGTCPSEGADATATDFLGASCSIRQPRAVAAGSTGDIYLAMSSDSGQRSGIIRIDPAGLIHLDAGCELVAPTWDCPSGAIDGPALDANVHAESLDVGPGGRVVFVDDNGLRRLTAEGDVRTIAANVEPPASCSGAVGCYAVGTIGDYTGDVSVARDGAPWMLAASREIGIFSPQVARIDGAGNVMKAAGVKSASCSGNPWELSAVGGVAFDSCIAPSALSHDFEGNLTFNHGNSLVKLGFDVVAQGSEITVPSSGGDEVHVFSRAGRHLRTLYGRTLQTKYLFGYDGAGRLVTVDDAFSMRTTLERDGTGQLTGIEAPHGQLLAVTANAGGLLASMEDEENGLVEFTYHAGTQLLATKVDARGGLHTFTFDTTVARLSVDEDPAGGSSTLARTVSGTTEEVTVTSELGRVTEYATARTASGGQLQTMTPPSGHSASADSTGTTTKVTRPDGTVTTTTTAPDPVLGLRAPFVKLREVKLPSGLTHTTTRTRTKVALPAGAYRIDEQTTVNGVSSAQKFTSDTRVIERTSAEGRVTRVTLNAQERPTLVERPALDALTLIYDAEGRLDSTEQGAGAQMRTTLFDYGTDGFLASVTDTEQRVTSFTRDLLGRSTTITAPGPRNIGLGFNPHHGVTSVTPPSQPAHALDYTPVDLPSSYTPPDVLPGTDATTWSYNFDRQLTTTTRPDALTIARTYDTAGRLATVVFSRGTMTYGYSASTGQLASITAPGAQTLSFLYDGFLPKRATWGGTVDAYVAVTYDSDFRVTSRDVDGVSTTSFTHDDDGLLTSAGALTLTRDPASGFITDTTVATVSTTHDYDPFGALESGTASTSSGNLLSFGFTRDKLGRITQRVETFGATTTTTLDFRYDTAGRLDQVKTNGTVSASYSYDDNGNRLSGPAASTYSYDDQDRLTSAGSTTFTYTANGELATKTTGTDVTAYTYDTLGNLTDVDLPSGTAIDYVIDGLSRRIAKKVDGVLVKQWVYDSQLRIAAELDGAGALVSTFVYATRVNVPDVIIKSGVTYRVLGDQVGSVRRVVNASTGAVAQDIAYDEFGVVTSDSNPGFQPFGFAGGLYDPDAGLVRFGARDYFAGAGRWIAKDPIRFAGGDTNLYAYVANDPVNGSDPSGLVEERYFGTSWDYVDTVSSNPGATGAFTLHAGLTSSCVEVADGQFALGFDLSYRGEIEIRDDLGPWQFGQVCGHEATHAARQLEAVRNMMDFIELFEGTYDQASCRILAGLIGLEFEIRLREIRTTDLWQTDLAPPTDGAGGTGYAP